MEREKFEQSWKHAFDGAETNPSEKVWTNIELDLERARGGELKRRLMFYKMLAAASVVFAMAIGGVGYYYSFQNSSGSGPLAQHEPQVDDANALAEAKRPIDSDSVQGGHSHSTAPTSPSTAREQRTADNISRPSSDEERPVEQRRLTRTPASGDYTHELADPVFSVAEADDHRREGFSADGDEPVTGGPDLPSQIDERQLPSLVTARDVKLNFEKNEPEIDPVVAMLARLEQREMELRDDKDNKRSDEVRSESLWTSIGFSAGSFNAVQAPSASNAPSTVGYMAALTAPIVEQESKASGFSYSMGLNVGTRISERWVLQGGVNYLTQASEYTANSLVVDGPAFMSTSRYKPMTTNAIVNADEYELGNRVVYSAPYNVNNSMRYLSIPVQAGYLIVDKTIGVQLNAGVATDLFLQNTVKGESDQLASATQPGGSDSPYRTINLSGLVGTELSYRFGPHYRVSVNPGIRYPFNTIYKSGLGVQSSPLTFDVGLRFRYIFR